MREPSAFIPSQGGAYRPPATLPSQTEDTRAPYRVASGPANEVPVLSIAYPNTCTLSRPLVAELALTKMGSRRVHIVVPAKRGGQWYLDTMPRPGVGARFPERGAARFRIQQVPKMHFMQARPLFAPGGGAEASMRGNANVFVRLLHFRLGSEVAGHAGYYYLEPIQAKAQG